MSRHLRLLVGGNYLLYKLFKEIVRRLTGVSAEAPLVVTLFALGVLMNALRRVVAPALGRLRPSRPSVPALAAMTAIPAAVVHRATHAPHRDTPVVAGGMALGAGLPVLHALGIAAHAIPAALGAVARLLVGKQ